MSKMMPQSLVKEEIMVSDLSDVSDKESRKKIDDRKHVLCLKLVNLQCAKITYPKSVSDSYHQESYIKEELIISDISDSSDDDEPNNINNNLAVHEKSPLRTQENKNECLITEAAESENEPPMLHKINRVVKVVLKRLTLSEVHKKRPDNNLKVCTDNKLTVKYKRQKTNAALDTVNSSFSSSHVSNSSSRSSTRVNYYHCIDCDRKYHFKRDLLYHIKDKHSDALDADGFVECKRCKRKIRGILSLKKHMAYCGALPHLYCKFCPLKVKFKNCLKVHILRVHKDVDPASVDGILDKIVKKGKKLLKDGALKPTSKDTFYTSPQKWGLSSANLLLYCSKCDRSHKRFERQNAPNCQVCSTPLLHECAKCAKRYKLFSSAKAHLHQRCARQLLYRCNECIGKFTTSNKAVLRFHIVNRHLDVNEEDMLGCPKCGKLFKIKPYLLRHEKMCGIQAEFKCEYCPYRSKYRQTMRNHVHNHKLHLSVALDSTGSVAGATETPDKILQDNEKGESSVDRAEVLVNNPNIGKTFVGHKTDHSSTVCLICTTCKRTAKADSKFKKTECKTCKINMLYQCLACNEKICKTIGAMCYHKKKKCRLSCVSLQYKQA